MTTQRMKTARDEALGETQSPVTLRLAIIVLTPEYNHSCPGPLKTAIDAVGSGGYGEAFGLVSYGDMSGGLRAGEPPRVVFAKLRSKTVRSSVSFHGAWSQFDSHGRPLDIKGVALAADAMLNQLA